MSDNAQARIIAAAIFIACIAVVVGLNILHANFVYHDWHCAVAKCVIVKNTQP